ncbi:Halomucin [Frankliniella fusca]|uniref:Halomucin n=1 Tax=Frankliniella fusca TaxID=407009 RepID=A0AAE1GXL4_9NEOP|nr:Halomucin [Frankliniella fusca]
MDPEERRLYLRRSRYRRKKRRLLDHNASDSEPESDHSEASRESSNTSASSAASYNEPDEAIHDPVDNPMELDQNNMQAGFDDVFNPNNDANNPIEENFHGEEEVADRINNQDVDNDAVDEEEQDDTAPSEPSSESDEDSEDERHFPSEDSESDRDSEASVYSSAEEGSDDDDHSEESGNSDEEGGDHENEGNQPIYPGAPITLHESLLAIFTLLSAEHLTGKLVGIILKLIALHCPDGSILKKTLHTLKKYFSKLGGSTIVYHYYCDSCIYPLKTKESRCPKCKKTGNVSFFIELPLFNQLQHMFRRPNFHDNLQYRFDPMRKHVQGNIEDIYDGRIYQDEMGENGFLSEENNLSFMWYSDGVQVFKSSSFSIWPLCLAVNELPYKMRVQPENILLVGLWFGRHKPSPNIFLKPLHKTMERFSSEGHTFQLSNNLEVLVKAKILCGVCDLPAKCKFLLFKQFNAAFGCPVCLAPGGRMPVGRSATVQVYPFQAINVELRTHAQTQLFAEQALLARAVDKKASVNGVKGPTLLSKLVPDIIRCTAIDIMHGVFLGVCRLQMTLWFSSKYSNQPWSLHHLENVLDEKLRSIKPPSYVQRIPRSLKDIKLWKASEFKLFLMYYSVLILKNAMDDLYLKHHCLLVSGISLLSQDSISVGQVEAARTLLLSYVNDYARLYSLRHLGLNVHQLIHLPNVVLDLGPLWAYSCFFFENFNGKLNRLYHGTQHIALQVCSSVSMLMTVPILTDGLDPDSKAYEFCKFVSNCSQAVKVADRIDEKTLAVGVYSTGQQEIRNIRDCLRRTQNVVNGNCNIFYRLKKGGIMYYSKHYPVQSKCKESSFILVKENETVQFGQILRFVRWSDCNILCETYCRNCPVSYHAMVQIYERAMWFIHDMPGVRMSYISKVVKTDNVIAVNVNSICNLCFHFEMDDSEYIATPVNNLEVE